MNSLVKLTPLSHDIWIYLLIYVSVILFFMLALVAIQAKMSGINLKQEMSERDNFAYSIGMAGGLLGFCIVLSSVVGRHVGDGYESAVKSILLFGVLGILLVRFGRIVHDKLVLNRINTPELLQQRNIGVALVDGVSAVASAIILRSMILWVEGSDLNAVIALTSGFIVVLVIFVSLTRFYEWRFARNNQQDSFQGALKRGQLAAAIDHVGNLLGTAIVITGASSVLVYSPEAYVTNVTGWLIVSVGLALSLLVLVGLSKYIILFGVDVNKEIDLHQNIGIAGVGFVLNIGFALIVVEILSRA